MVTKPTPGATGWNVAVDEVIDIANSVADLPDRVTALEGAGGIGDVTEAELAAGLATKAAAVHTHSDLLDQTAGDNRYILQANANAFAPADATTTALAGKQPIDADLTALAGLDSATSGTVASDGAGWVKKTYAQLRTALGLATVATSGKLADVTDVTATGAAVGGVVAVKNLTGGVADQFGVAQAPIDVRMMGAVADGTTDDMAAFSAARTAAGANGIVKFSAKPGASVTTYYLAGARPDLSGTQITADPTVVLKLDENPNTKTARFLTPVTVQNPVHGTTIRKPAAVDLPIEAITAANVHPAPLTPVAEDFTTWTTYNVSGGQTITAGTSTKAANLLSWSSAFAAGQEGAYTQVQPGALYEATIETTDATASGFVSVQVLSSPIIARRVDFAASKGVTQLRRFVDGGTPVELPVPANGSAYTLPAPGSVVLGLRFLNATDVEFYVNGVLIERYTLPFGAYRVGFTVTSGQSNAASIKDPMRYNSAAPAAQREYVIDSIGDSIGYGAWASYGYFELLPAALAGLPGGGGATMRTNHSVSGTSTAAWVSGGAQDIASKSFTGATHVLVMLGTNDVQVGTSVATFLANLATIANKIVADGAVPVFAIFPMWTAQSVTGYVGVSPTNYNLAAKYRSAIARFCATNGYPMARTHEATGKTLSWINDNIHPRVMGHAAIARAFAQAIARSNGGDHEPTRPGWSAWAAVPSGWLANSWALGGSTPAQYRTHMDGSVELRGDIASGTLGQTAINLPTALRPPIRYGFAVPCVSAAAAEVYGSIRVQPGGTLTVHGGDNNLVILNQCRWVTI